MTEPDFCSHSCSRRLLGRTGSALAAAALAFAVVPSGHAAAGQDQPSAASKVSPGLEAALNADNPQRALVILNGDEIIDRGQREKARLRLSSDSDEILRSKADGFRALASKLMAGVASADIGVIRSLTNAPVLVVELRSKRALAILQARHL